MKLIVKKTLFTLFLIVFLFLPIIVSTASTPSIKINSDKNKTDVRKVILSIQGPDNVSKMKISNEPNFEKKSWINFTKSKVWWLDYGVGLKTVYIKFKDNSGKISDVYKDTITLDIPKIMTVDFNFEDKKTKIDSRYIKLDLKYSKGVEEIAVSNDVNFKDYETFNPTSVINWVLSSGNGNKTVYVGFSDANDEVVILQKNIMYNEPDRYIKEGSLIKGQNSPTIYYYGFDGKIHPFYNATVYNSWYPNFNFVQGVSSLKLSQYRLGDSVCVKQGTYLLKFTSGPKIYSVGNACQLRALRSPVEAFVLYGSDWQKKIIEFDDSQRSLYSIDSFEIGEDGVDIVDADRDGVSLEDEEKNGSSDKVWDTDGDDLSDYEEIFYWFTDPNKKDTDNDGFGDGYEILSKYSPVGLGDLTNIPANSYSYYEGTIFRYRVGNYYNYYYNASNGAFYISKSVGDKNFVNNNFRGEFIVQSPMVVGFIKVGNITTNLVSLYRPRVLNKSGETIDL